MSDFYNTTGETGLLLKSSREAARNQQEVVHLFFLRNRRDSFTPEDVLSAEFGHSVPITSVRRAITNLTRDGVLEKTTCMSMGKWGKYVHTWKFREI